MNGRLAASSPLQGEALKVREAHLDSASALARGNQDMSPTED